MGMEINPPIKNIIEKQKRWKYIKSLGKTIIPVLLLLLGVSETINAQNQDKNKEKITRNELIKETKAVGLNIYRFLTKNEPLPLDYDGTSFHNAVTDEEIYCGREYNNSYLDSKIKNREVRFYDENGDGQLDRLIFNKENFKSKNEKRAILFPLTSSEHFLENELELSKFGEMFRKKIQVAIFKDIEKTPRLIAYDLEKGEYGETDAEGVYETWLAYQKEYKKHLEVFYSGITTGKKTKKH
jgi:hypothetical protein